jgi:GAF domain-containing protein
MPQSDSVPARDSAVDQQPDVSPAVGPRALAALHELAVAASGVLEPTALAKLAVDLACDLLGVDGAALYWWDSSTGLLVSLADNRDYQAGGKRTLQPGKGVAGLAFERQAPLIIDDYPNWEGAVPWALDHGVLAAVGIPLVARGRTVGAMAVLTHAPGGFDADDLRLLSLLAAQVAPSLEAGRLDVDLAASEQRFRSLYGTLASGVLVLSASGLIPSVSGRSCSAASNRSMV